MLGCNCGGTFNTTKIGVVLQTTASFGPYRLYQADELTCDKCGHVIYRTAPMPFSEHYEEGFDELRRNAENFGLLRELDPR